MPLGEALCLDAAALAPASFRMLWTVQSIYPFVGNVFHATHHEELVESEPRRDCRRLYLLRGWSHDEEDELTDEQQATVKFV